MSTSYIDLYEILDVFEDNAYQKIMMGTPYNNPEEIVIINCLNTNNSWAKKIFETAKSTLKNLVHSEILPDSLVLVTEYQEGKTIDEYIKSISDDNRRYYLAKNYLQSIAPYETFNSYMQTILVDKNQIIMQENNLLMNSVMIMDEQIENNLSFPAVIDKIKDSLETIFYAGTSSFDETANKRISAFIATLSPNRMEYHCIADIVVAFEKAFTISTDEPMAFAPMSLDSDEQEISNTQESDDAMFFEPMALDTEDNSLPTPETQEIDDSVSFEKISLDSEEEDAASNDIAAGVAVGVAGVAGVAAANAANQKEIELDGLTVVNEMFDNSPEPEEKEKKDNKKSLLLLLLLLILLGIAGYKAYTHFYPAEQDLLPKASFIRTVNDNKQYFENKSVAFGKDNQVVSSEWTVYTIADDGSEKKIKSYNKRNLNLFIKTPGTYKTELKVQDSKGQWSDVISEEFVLEDTSLDTSGDNSESPQATEKLDSLNLNFNTDNILFDDSVFRSGTRSLHFDLDKGDGTITINDIFVDNSAILSVWAYADSTEPVILNITAYDDGKKVFSHKKKHVFKAANTWEMIEMKLPNKSATKLEITISGKGQLWIDDIDISTFK